MLNVDKKKCIGCGTCIALYPDCFKMDENGKVYIMNKCTNKDKVNILINSCPVNAINNK